MKKNKTIKGWVLFTISLLLWIGLIDINFNNVQLSWAVIWLIFGSLLYWFIYFLLYVTIVDEIPEIEDETKRY